MALGYTDARNAVVEIADEYKQMGYSVSIEPTTESLPDFLKGYQPDIVATRNDEAVVVEVKTKGKIRRTDYWTGLAQAIEHHPGWRFELVLDKNRLADEAESEPVLDAVDVKARAEEAEKIASMGMLDAAFLVLWPATEAALRHLAARSGVRTRDKGIGSLISALYSDGELSREDFDLLIRYLSLRNASVHGYETDRLGTNDIENLKRIISYSMRKSRRNSVRADN